MTRKETWAEKQIDRARTDCIEIAKVYGVAESAVVWCGGNKYAVVKDGKTIWI